MRRQQNAGVHWPLPHRAAHCPGWDLTAALVTLANFHSTRGDGAAGEPLARRALDIHLRLLGGVHPESLASMNQLADILLCQGSQHNHEIETLRIEVLERSRRILGEDHSLVATANSNLALFLATRQGIGITSICSVSYGQCKGAGQRPKPCSRHP